MSSRPVQAGAGRPGWAGPVKAALHAGERPAALLPILTHTPQTRHFPDLAEDCEVESDSIRTPQARETRTDRITRGEDSANITIHSEFVTNNFVSTTNKIVSIPDNIVSTSRPLTWC